VIFGAGRNEVSKFHWSTGQVQNVTPIPVRDDAIRVDRTEPLLFSPLDPHTLYYAANRIYKTTDGGATWQTVSPDLTREQPGLPASVGDLHVAGSELQRGAIYALAVSAHSIDTLWAGTDDGLIWKTGDSGEHWSNVTPSAVTAWSKVTQIEASHFDANTDYVSVSRMRIDDLHPYIFRTHDGGSTWQRIDDGLPLNAPVNAVREDSERKGLLFAATENAVWVSCDDGGHWDSLQINLPHTSMRDLWIHDDDLILATHGRSIWILDDISRLRQLKASNLRDAVLVDPAPAYLLRRSTWTDTPIPPDEPVAPNPPAGAIIDYFLPTDTKGLVTLEVFDNNGALVRRFRSDDRLEPSAEELARELIPQYWIAQPRALPTRSGMHRWIWDLHYRAPLTTARGYPISAVPHATPQGPEGPLAVAGSYRVRLTVGGKRLETALTLKPDPRVRLAAAALQDQLRLATKLADLLSTSSRALLTARSEHEQLKALATTGATAEVVQRYDARLSALLGSAEKDEDQHEGTTKLTLTDVHSQIDTLYTEVNRADAAPTAAQLSTSVAAEAALSGLLRTWQQLQADLPSLNGRLRAAKFVQIRPQLPPPTDLNAADED
jgi:hypothetical protein